MPKFTIAIPTYNRSGFLRRSIASALAQSYSDVEVLVSDNASTDDTESVCRSFGDRVRYHRNGENIGIWRNFVRVAELADGEYFSWLQDDDLVHRDYARRAVEALDPDPAVAMYTAYAFDSHSCNTFVHPYVIGPPVAVDWMNPSLRMMDGSMVAPVSLFYTFSMPPVTAYRIEVIRPALAHLDDENPLFNERILQSHAVDGRKIAVDPFAAGIFFKHPGQASLLGGSCDVAERSRQWVAMANHVAAMIEPKFDELRTRIDDWLESVAPDGLLTIYLHDLAPAGYWKGLNTVAFDICSRIVQYLPRHFQDSHRRAIDGVAEGGKGLRSFARRLAPPILWDAAKLLKQGSRLGTDKIA
jgi:glycosyltransferase involved in cell wall biosynthesis